MFELLIVFGWLIGGGVSLAVYRFWISDEFVGPDLIFIPLLWPIFLPIVVAYLVMAGIFERFGNDDF